MPAAGGVSCFKKRKATGEPYIMYRGNVNKQNPDAYKTNGLKVYMTNICSEIVLHTDDSHSFVCCLSSLNLAKYDEWCDTELVYYSTLFLDGVLEEFIQKAKNMRGFENSVRSAERAGHLAWEYSDGTPIYNKRVSHLRDCKHISTLVRFSPT